MFSTALSLVREPVNLLDGLATSQKVAIPADFILGVALLAIGICATQWNFMPANLQYVMIGVGSACFLFTSLRTGSLIKEVVSNERYVEGKHRQ